MNPSSEKKSHSMGIRFDEKTHKLLERFSREMNMKKGKLLKFTFDLWVKSKLVMQVESMLIVGKTLFKQLIEYFPDEQLRDLAETDAEIGLNKCKIHLIDQGQEFTVKTYLDFFTDIICEKGMNWFDSIKYQKPSDDRLTIYGIHSLNEKFSVFFRDLMEHTMQKGFNYKLINNLDNISKTTVSLDFKKVD